MANKHTSLEAHSLSELHVPLSSTRDRTEPVAPPVPEGIATRLAVAAITSKRPPVRAGGDAPIDLAYPTLARKKKEYTFPKSFRLPMSHIEFLERMERERGINPSDLVRDFIEKGKADIEASELKEKT